MEDWRSPAAMWRRMEEEGDGFSGWRGRVFVGFFGRIAWRISRWRREEAVIVMGRKILFLKVPPLRHESCTFSK